MTARGTYLSFNSGYRSPTFMLYLLILSLTAVSLIAVLLRRVVSQIPLQRLAANWLRTCWRANMSATSWQLPRLRGNVCNGFWALASYATTVGLPFVRLSRAGIASLVNVDCRTTRKCAAGCWLTRCFSSVAELLVPECGCE